MGGSELRDAAPTFFVEIGERGRQKNYFEFLLQNTPVVLRESQETYFCLK